MRTIADTQEPATSIVGFSPDFRPADLGTVGRKAMIAIRVGGKINPWNVAIMISKELGREAEWVGESHIVIGVPRNPSIKQLELRCCPETTHNARRISIGRTYLQVRAPYVRDLQAVIPEIKFGVEAKVLMTAPGRIVLDLTGIKATGMPSKK